MGTVCKSKTRITLRHNRYKVDELLKHPNKNNNPLQTEIEGSHNNTT